VRQISGTHLFKSFSGLSRAFKSRPVPERAQAQEAQPGLHSQNGCYSIRAPREWLREMDWDKIVAINQAQCQLQNTQTTPNSKTYDQVREMWERRVADRLTIDEALEVCRQCQEKAAFIFSNTSTFAQITKEVLQALLKGLPSLEAHIVQNTAANYVTGKVSKKELSDILRFCESQWMPTTKISQNGTGERSETQSAA